MAEPDQPTKQPDTLLQKQTLGTVLLVEYFVNPISIIEEAYRKMTETENKLLISECNKRAKIITNSDGNKSAATFLLGAALAFVYLDRYAQKTGTSLPVVHQTDVDQVDNNLSSSETKALEIRKTLGKSAESTHRAEASRTMLAEFDPVLWNAVKYAATVGQPHKKDAAYFGAGARFVNILLTKQPKVATTV